MVSDQCLLLLVNFLLRFKYVTMLNVLNMPRSLTILSMLTVPIMLILLIIQAMMQAMIEDNYTDYATF